MVLFQSRIAERAAYLPDRVRAHIAAAVAQSAEAAELAQCAYENAVAGAEKASSERIVGVLRNEATRTREHFEEILEVACVVATDMLSDMSSEEPPSMPTSVVALNSRDVPPHQFRIRDLVNVDLEIPVIGKVIARSCIIAICELTSGCHCYSDSGAATRVVRKGTRFLGTVDEHGKVEPIIPYLAPEQKTEHMGHVLRNVDIETEGICGITVAVAGVSASARPNYAGYFAKQVDKWAGYKLNYGAWSTDPLLKPKFKVLRYERSYRVLVAAPIDFNLGALKTRAAGGERLDLRFEVEKVLLGQQTPTLIYGAGVGFEHVLESQLSQFAIKHVMTS
jgi:hypothetical protein